MKNTPIGNSNEALFSELSKFLDNDQLIRGNGTNQDTYSKTTLGSQKKSILGIVLPHNKSEIITILKIVEKFNIAVYPVSRGNNWGYGNASPVIDGCLILDMSAMNKIVHFNIDLGLVTVEPGVSYKQLYEYIEGNNLPFLCPVSGARENASLIGNALERGVSGSPMYDRFNSIMAMEAILADGTVYTTDSTTKSPLITHGYYKWGRGPYLDGIFGQSNMGIVTQVTFALVRKSEHSEAFFIEIRKEEELQEIIERTRQFLFDVKNDVSIRIRNSSRLAQHFRETPPFRWLLVGVNYGTKETVRARRKTTRSRFGIHARYVFFFNRNILRFLSDLKKKFPLIKKIFPYTGILEKSLDATEGIGSKRKLKLMVPLTNSQGKLLSVNDSRLGLIFFTGVTPLLGETIAKSMVWAEGVCQKYGFFPAISLHNASERCMFITLRIVYDKNNEMKCKNANMCYLELLKDAHKHDVFPSRVTIDAMGKIFDPEQPFWKLVAKIKKAIDPENIISPGRYGPE